MFSLHIVQFRPGPVFVDGTVTHVEREGSVLTGKLTVKSKTGKIEVTGANFVASSRLVNIFQGHNHIIHGFVTDPATNRIYFLENAELLLSK